MQLSLVLVGHKLTGFELYDDIIDDKVHTVVVFKLLIFPVHRKRFLTLYFNGWILVEEVLHSCFVCGFEEACAPFVIE